jgi:exodeoxyribonuclease V alpha subunit
VFNGDGGVITRIDAVDQIVEVRLEDERLVEYDFTDLDQLALAYAISIHKSQGSEYPCVVMPVLMSHFMMLERKLVYTGLTRARKLAVLVGSRKAIGIAVRNGGVSGAGRMTGLRGRIA